MLIVYVILFINLLLSIILIYIIFSYYLLLVFIDNTIRIYTFINIGNLLLLNINMKIILAKDSYYVNYTKKTINKES